MTSEEMKELKGLAASMGLYDDKKPCKRSVILGKAIKALEQEPVLAKIRAEIQDLQYGPEEKSMTDEDRADAYNNAISQAIEIIDKYKAEDEG